MSKFWRSINKYEGYYEVSNMGEIRSLNRTILAFNGGSKKIESVRRIGKLLKQSKTSGGYLIINLWKDGRMVTRYVHQIVIGAFTPNIENKEFVNHIDGNKSNNNISNLEWCTQSENAIHSFYVLGKNSLLDYLKTHQKEKHPSNKSVIMIGRDNVLIKTFPSVTLAGKEMNIDPNCIIRICKGRGVLSGGYKWKYA